MTGRGPVRDALLLLAPVAALGAGLASIAHHQHLVEAGYRVAALQREREGLEAEVQSLRVSVGRLTSPRTLLARAREMELPLDYPREWNHVNGPAEAARFAGAAGERGAGARIGAAPRARRSR